MSNRLARAAHQGRNIGADASRQQNADAVSTSLGVRAKLTATRKANASFNGGKRPSAAGLDNGKSAWVQPHGSGYSTKRTRGALIPKDLSRPVPRLTGAGPASNGMVNYVRGSSGTSSMSILASKQEFDRTF